MLLDGIGWREAAEPLCAWGAWRRARIHTCRITIGCLLTRRDLEALAPPFNAERDVQRLEDIIFTRDVDAADELVICHRAVPELGRRIVAVGVIGRVAGFELD